MPGRRPFCGKSHASSHDLANRGARGRFQSAPPSRSGFFRNESAAPYVHHAGASAFSGELEKERGADSVSKTEFRDRESVLFVGVVHGSTCDYFGGLNIIRVYVIKCT